MRLKDLNPGPFIVCSLVVASWLIVICSIQGGIALYTGLFGKERHLFPHDGATLQAPTVSTEQHIACLVARATKSASSTSENPTAQMGWSVDVEELDFVNLGRFGGDFPVRSFLEQSRGGFSGERGDEKTSLEGEELFRSSRDLSRVRGLAPRVVPLKKSTLVKDARSTQSDPVIELPFLM